MGWPWLDFRFSTTYQTSGIVPSTPITIGITVTFIYNSFLFSSPTRFKKLSLFSFSSIFTLWNPWTTKSTIRQVLFFSLDLAFWLRFGDLFVSKNPREVCTSHSPWVSQSTSSVEYTDCTSAEWCDPPPQRWLVVWVLWHINRGRSFNAKFCLYMHTYSTKDFKTNIKVGKIFY